MLVGLHSHLIDMIDGGKKKALVFVCLVMLFLVLDLKGYLTNKEAPFPENLSNSPKVTQLLNNLAGTNIYIFQFLIHCF